MGKYPAGSVWTVKRRCPPFTENERVTILNPGHPGKGREVYVSNINRVKEKWISVKKLKKRIS